MLLPERIKRSPLNPNQKQKQKSMKMTAPNITKGDWKVEVWEYPEAKPPRKELNVQNAEQLIATLQWDEGLENPYTVQELTAKANARAFAALPAVLAALHGLTEAVAAHRDQVTIENLNRLCDAEDAAKAALESAGYGFAE
jgi:hypothetical protein